jgi:hypothetical protein
MANSKSELKPRFWRGPIASEAQAQLIIRCAAWPVIALSFSPALQGIFAILKGNSINGFWSVAGFAAMFATSVAVLIKKDFRTALLFLVITPTLTIHAGAELAYMLIKEQNMLGIAILFVSLIWVALTMQAWRAFQAARALPKLRAGKAFSWSD